MTIELSNASTLSQMMTYSSLNKEHYPGLNDALRSLNDYVGMVPVKESIAENVQYILSCELESRSERRSPVLTRAAKSRLKQKACRKRRNYKWSRSKRCSSKKPVPKKPTNRIVREQIEEISRVLIDSFGGESDEDEDYDSDEENFRPLYARTMNLNTLLMGDPGTGKTSIAHTLHAIWSSLGLVRKDRFRVVTRGDLVGKYQGHSTAKIRKILSECQNGVLFIDEAYSLLNDEKDSFGSEVMAEIVECMTSTKWNVTFIMAGYEKSIRKSILGHNEGLERRFGSIYKMPKPSHREMAQIFQRMVKREKWRCNVDTDAIAALYDLNQDVFRFAGGDMEVLLHHVKRSHIKRLWPEGMSRRILSTDIKDGIETFKKSKDRTARSVPLGMYS